MTSFPAGMEQLVATLAQGKTVAYNTAVTAVRRNDRDWLLHTGNGTFTARTLIVAVPVNSALGLLAPFTPPMPSVPEARIATVALGFSGTADIPRGFGYLAPEQEQRFALGALFSSHMFPGRAPRGNFLLEALVGGRRHPERLSLSDNETVQRTYDDLRQLLSLPEPPVFARVLRPSAGIPQMEMGHPRLHRWQHDLEQHATGLSLCGFGWEGIGMNDMIRAAKKAAAHAVSGITGSRRPAQVKPVYF